MHRRRINRLILRMLFVWVGFCGNHALANTIAFDFSNVNNSTILFPGDNTFRFNDVDGGFHFSITNSTSSPLLVGLTGKIQGTYTIGLVSTFFGVETASVNGTGIFSVFDGADTFTALLDWLDIAQTGTLGLLNTSATTNLTALTYTGTNVALLELASHMDGVVTLSFQFGVPTSLTTLRDGPGPFETSYSGSLESVTESVTIPEPGSLLLLGAGLIGLALAKRRR